jgi:hypothetical protein
VVLLTGVWIVSIKSNGSRGAAEVDIREDVNPEMALEEEEAAMDMGSSSSDLKNRFAGFSKTLLSEEGPRGLSIGISASSPGESHRVDFYICPFANHFSKALLSDRKPEGCLGRPLFLATRVGSRSIRPLYREHSRLGPLPLVLCSVVCDHVRTVFLCRAILTSARAGLQS